MVEISNTTSSNITRKRKSLHKSTINKISRYPPDYLFSSLTYKQASKTLSISQKSVLVSNSNQFNIIAGDLFNSNSSIHKNPIKLVENYHNQNTITHLKWNQKGNAIASVDETGQLAIWQIQNSVNDWTLVYKTNLKQPLASILWLNSDRLYNFELDTLKREPVIGPRNPFGQLSFITVTVHGEITVYYQRNASIFSMFLTHLPNIGRREISRVDAGCYGMSLAGLKGWERISHADLMLNHDGTIYLATHHASTQPKTISIYTIRIKFPKKSVEKGAIECRPLTSLKLEGKNKLLKENNITQLVFKNKHNSPMELVIGLGETTETGQFQAFISTWQLNNIQKSITGDIGTISVNKIELKYQSGVLIQDKFITAITSTSEGHIITGLSDGSIHMEMASNEGFFKSTCDNANSIDSQYWNIADAHKTDDGCIDFIRDMVLSPNETHVIYSFSSGKIGISRITSETLDEDYAKSIYQKLQLCLLNDSDYLDLISEIIHIYKQDKDRAYEMIKNVLDAYEIHYNEDGDTLQSNQPIENWNLALLEKGYGLALAIYKRLPEHQVQYQNLCRAVQLPMILECFKSSCLSNQVDIERVLNKTDDNTKLEFDSNSLWSLVSLSTWVYDYLKWILREWNMFLNCKRPNSKDMTHKSVHAVLLLHKDSRYCLIKLLKLVHSFIQYATTANYQLDDLPDSQILLQKYIDTLLNDDIINIKDTIQFLNELDNLQTNTTDIENRWSLLLTSNLKNYSILDIQQISSQYKDRCAKPSIYINNDLNYKYDVIRKRRLLPQTKLHRCIRCQQQEIAVDPVKETSDPCYYAQWYQSFGKHCVCGGLFY